MKVQAEKPQLPEFPEKLVEEAGEVQEVIEKASRVANLPEQVNEAVAVQDAEELVREQLKEEIKRRLNISDNDIADLVAKLYFERKKEDAQLTKQALNILPALAKADNPMVLLALNQLFGQKRGDDSDDLVKAIREAQLLSVLPAIQSATLKKVFESLDFGNSTERLMMQYLIQQAQKKEEQLYSLLMQMTQEKKTEEVQKLREELQNAISEFNATISEVLNKFADMVYASRSEVHVQAGQKDIAEEIAEMKEKLETMVEALKLLGFDVRPPNAADSTESQLKQIEVQMKLKELELKEKELATKQEFMRALGEGIKELLGKPENIIRIIQGVRDILRPPGPAVAGMQKAAAVDIPDLGDTAPAEPIPEPKPPASLDLDELIEDVANAKPKAKKKAGGGKK
jgi:predicted DNA-binding ArsR family transcriptional regulator